MFGKNLLSGSRNKMNMREVYDNNTTYNVVPNSAQVS